jgi:hypothetical protein
MNLYAIRGKLVRTILCAVAAMLLTSCVPIGVRVQNMFAHVGAGSSTASDG